MGAALIDAERFFRKAASKYGLLHDIEILSATTHAVTSAYLSIACALSETVFSIATGSKEDSMSLFGVAIMSAVDLTGSLLVLYRWRFMSQSFSKTQIQKVEIYFSAAIGVLMGLLGVTLFQTSIIKLIVHDSPTHVGYGVAVGFYGAFTSLLLFFYKVRVGRVLQSLVVLTDAKCSLCLCLISMAVAMALMFENVMWWSDGVMGALVAVYVMRESYTSLKSTLGELRASADDSEGVRLMTVALGVARGGGSSGALDDTGDEEDEEDASMIKFDTQHHHEESQSFTFHI